MSVINEDSLISAGSRSNVVTTVSSDRCFMSDGVTVTKDGQEWYEVQNVNGHDVSYKYYFLNIFH